MRVLIDHEEPIVTAGLMAVLGPRSEFSTTVSSSVPRFNGGEVARLDAFDVIVADYQGGLKLVAEIKTRYRECGIDGPRVIVLTQLSREWEVRHAVNAGVFGYILQGCAVEDVIAGVRMVGARRRYMCESVTECIAESLTRVSLTGRETEVLALLQRGMCNKTIARDLGVAPGTVKAHVRGILEKLESSTRTQAVAVATHRGLIREGTRQGQDAALRYS